MWIYLKNSFLSIIDPDGSYDGSKGPVSTKLLVRGRFKGDIERIFPRAKVTETPKRDYRYRALVSRETVAKAMFEAVMQNGAKNFKGSTKEKWRHDVYMQCWFAMEAEQRRQHDKAFKPEDDLFEDDFSWSPRNPYGNR
jgi:hypothetical protein